MSLIQFSKFLVTTAITIMALTGIAKSASATPMTAEIFCNNLKTHISSPLTAKFVNVLNQQDFPYYLPRTFFGSEQNNRTPYIGVAAVLKKALNFSSEPIISQSLNDLKMIPYAQQGSHFLLFTATAEPLNSERLQAVINTANRMEHRISIFWRGSNDSMSLELLQKLAVSTQGVFLDIQRVMAVCLSTEQNPL